MPDFYSAGLSGTSQIILVGFELSFGLLLRSPASDRCLATYYSSCSVFSVFRSIAIIIACMSRILTGSRLSYSLSAVRPVFILRHSYPFLVSNFSTFFARDFAQKTASYLRRLFLCCMLCLYCRAQSQRGGFQFLVSTSCFPLVPPGAGFPME